MEKKPYKDPVWEIVEFEVEDVITTSDLNATGRDDSDPDW